ncbi:TBC1 domain family member 15/17 [Brevipalpus obovatus]|uniref:TBC1 domain family member 15/17 n=1 Tax=Brevipalpus obovatus TaxID=246614 RepID=UPI003D9DCFA4
MSQVHCESNHSRDDDEEDSQVDFCNLSTRSLQRPSDHYIPPPRRYHFAERLLRDPLTTALSQFSRVTNYVLSPYEDDYYLPWNHMRHPHNSGDRVDGTSSGRNNSGGHASHRRETESNRKRNDSMTLPPPALPPIECSVPQNRLPLLTEAEFDETVNLSKKSILKRVFKGGIATHPLRRKIWPLILGLTDNIDMDWSELKSLYDHYNKQWRAILPDQESRFTAYRERKNLIERDVIRCDRTHPFFANSKENLDKLQQLLMAYIMYDFDTGYVQGMTDLASPLLFVWEGDVTKAFWCFVSIMKLFRRNFELTQNSMSNQLTALMKLIKITDPVFAQYLTNNESDNCYFAFRWLICLFKREFMKSKTDDYDDCLIVWETIWSLHALCTMESGGRDTRNGSESSATGRENPINHHQSSSREEEDEHTVNATPTEAIDDNDEDCRSTDRPTCQSPQLTVIRNGTDEIVSFSVGGDMNGARGNRPSPLPHNHQSEEHDEDKNSLKSNEHKSASIPTSDRDSMAEMMEKLSQRLNMDDLETYSLNQEPHSIGSTENAMNFHPKLENVELFCLCLCLAVIRRERDLILANKLEASDILKHFNQLHLNDCLNSILLHATTIWHWLKYDGGERLLYSDDEKPSTTSVEDFDLLNDEDCAPYSALSV